MATPPLISIIMPVHNGEIDIEESILSIVQQSYKNWELIIVDDYSTDNTVKIVQSIKRQDPRVKLFQHNTNKGVSAARNTALEQCKGSHIALLDADDISTPQRLESQIDYMGAHKLDLCGSAMTTFGVKEKHVSFPVNNEDIKYNLLFFKKSFSNSSVMMKASFIGNIRYNTSLDFAEDYAFWVALTTTQPCKIGNIDIPLTKYRTHKKQASKKLKHKNRISLCTTIKSVKQLNHLNISQIETHYDVWKKKKKLTIKELNDYVKIFNDIHKTHRFKEKEPKIYNQSLYELCKKQSHTGRNSCRIFFTHTPERFSIKNITLPCICALAVFKQRLELFFFERPGKT